MHKNLPSWRLIICWFTSIGRHELHFVSMCRCRCLRVSVCVFSSVDVIYIYNKFMNPRLEGAFPFAGWFNRQKLESSLNLFLLLLLSLLLSRFLFFAFRQRRSPNQKWPKLDKLITHSQWLQPSGSANVSQILYIDKIVGIELQTKRDCFKPENKQKGKKQMKN